MVVGFKVVIPLSFGFVVGTPNRMGSVLAGGNKVLLGNRRLSRDNRELLVLNRELLDINRETVDEICGRNEHSETQPSWYGPTSVGFATSARAKCAFIVLPMISRD